MHFCNLQMLTKEYIYMGPTATAKKLCIYFALMLCSLPVDCTAVDFFRQHWFWLFYRTQVSLGSDLWVRFSLTHWVSEEPCCKLCKLCKLYASYASNMQILQVMQADNANRAFRGNVAVQVHNQVKWYVQPCSTNVQPIWPKLQLLQLAPSGG